jgi:poly-gamma-glutamate synthesis protein (capsule biosynthesis protein)
MLVTALLNPQGTLALRPGTPRFRLLAGGDVCPILRLEAPLAAGRVDEIFAGSRALLQDADLAVINLESPLCRVNTPIAKCGPNFRAAPAIARTLREAGVDVCTLANNHILDQGAEGLAETLAALDSAGVQHLGAAPTTAAAAAPLRLTAGGGRLTLLNFAEGEYSRSRHGRPGAAPIETLANTHAVSAAAAQADWVVVFLHIGVEQVLFPSPFLRQRCRALIAAGATAVIAHHPHVPQGIEVWQGAPIVYSLGNLLFDWHEPEPETDSSFLLELGLGAPREVASLAVHPFRKSACTGIELLCGHARGQYVTFLNELSAPLLDDVQADLLWDEQCRMLWNSWYLPRLRRVAELESPDPALRHRAQLGIHNLFDHDSHRDLITRALELAAAGRFAPDPTVRPRLDQLMETLKGFVGG